MVLINTTNEYSNLEHPIHPFVRNFRASVYDEFIGARHKTRKDTRRILKPLYNWYAGTGAPTGIPMFDTSEHITAYSHQDVPLSPGERNTNIIAGYIVLLFHTFFLCSRQAVERDNSPHVFIVWSLLYIFRNVFTFIYRTVSSPSLRWLPVGLKVLSHRSYCCNMIYFLSRLWYTRVF